MPETKKNIEEANRFETRINKQKKADRFRFYVIMGITIVIILVILIWTLVSDYPAL